MKNKLIPPVIVFSLIALLMASLFIASIGTAFDDNKELQKDSIVDANDIIKLAGDFLDSGNSSNLVSAIQKTGFSLILYEPSGLVIYDSQDKNNAGKTEDINKISAQTALNQKLYIVISHGNKMAMALLSNPRVKPDMGNIKQSITNKAWLLFAGFILIILTMFLFIYLYILRPFKKLERFAGEVAKGNLDMPLAQNRQNFFGAFTWAFDMLRNELKTSTEKATEAEKTKKELVAALSHDVRTPIASIKAYSECLQSLQDKNSQRAEKYIEVILSKTDEITKLSQDMFLHALSDLEKLEINPKEHQSRNLILDLIEPLMLQFDNRIEFTSQIPDVAVLSDKIRLAQVFENIISNASKYAPESDILISSYITDGYLVCCFKDKGSGVAPEDIPFIFDKFYRGKNAQESKEPGSGLGLYISRYIMEKTGGSIKAYNYSEDSSNGFAVEVYLRMI